MTLLLRDLEQHLFGLFRPSVEGLRDTTGGQVSLDLSSGERNKREVSEGKARTGTLATRRCVRRT